MAVLTIATIVIVGGPTSSGAPSRTGSSWLYPNDNLSNTRDVVGSSISAKNVSSLKEAWSFKLEGKAAQSIAHLGSLAATPIVVDNLVYVQDLRCDVFALSLSSGSLLWEFRVGKPEKSGPGPNGVAVHDGVVYGLTPTTAFALNGANGKVVWDNKRVLKKGQGTFGIQPQVANGR